MALIAATVTARKRTKFESRDTFKTVRSIYVEACFLREGKGDFSH